VDAHDSVFKSWTGFWLSEWEKLTQRVCPVLQQYARSGQLKLPGGKPTKLTPQERLLSFVLYVKHNAGARKNSIDWNYHRAP
jgi:hypothetical protein